MIKGIIYHFFKKLFLRLPPGCILPDTNHDWSISIEDIKIGQKGLAKFLNKKEDSLVSPFLSA